MDELRDLTEALVSALSHENETAAGDTIEVWFREETDTDVARDDVGNVVARVSLGIGELLALVGHHDVVPPADQQTMDSGNHVVETRNGRLYGRGAADTKGAVAASMLAFRDTAADADSEVAFASFVGEEIGGEGVRTALDDGLELDYVVVTEGSTNYSGPNRTDVAVAHRGRRASTLVASGTACRANRPERGESAVYRATDAVDVVRGFSVPDAEVLDHPVSGSIAVTEIDSGSAWNVIPDRREVTLDEWIVSGGFVDLARTAELEGVEWVVEQDLPPMAYDDADSAKRVLNAARSVHEARSDAEPEQTTKFHATNAGWLTQAGTICVVYGSSEPDEVHTRDESVSLDVPAWCYETYRAPVANW